MFISIWVSKCKWRSDRKVEIEKAKRKL